MSRAPLHLASCPPYIQGQEIPFSIDNKINKIRDKGMPIEVIMNLLIKLQGGIIGINPLNNELLQCENKRYWMIKNLQYMTELHGPLCRRKKIPEEIKIDTHPPIALLPKFGSEIINSDS